MDAGVVPFPSAKPRAWRFSPLFERSYGGFAEQTPPMVFKGVKPCGKRGIMELAPDPPPNPAEFQGYAALGGRSTRYSLSGW
jgi:hypothetical protein